MSSSGSTRAIEGWLAVTNECLSTLRDWNDKPTPTPSCRVRADFAWELPREEEEERSPLSELIIGHCGVLATLAAGLGCGVFPRKVGQSMRLSLWTPPLENVAFYRIYHKEMNPEMREEVIEAIVTRAFGST